MTKTGITTIIIIVLIAGGAWYFLAKSNGGEAVTPTPSPTPITNPEPTPAPAPEPTTPLPTPNPAPTPTPTPATAVKEFTIEGRNFSFLPISISVNKGDKVKITFRNAEGMHDFRIDEYGVASKKTNSPSTEVLEFTANKTGSFEYYCSVGTHRQMGMHGTLTVK